MLNNEVLEAHTEQIVDYTRTIMASKISQFQSLT